MNADIVRSVVYEVFNFSCFNTDVLYRIFAYLGNRTYTLYNQQSVGSTLHNNLLFITNAAFLVGNGNDLRVH